MGDAIRKAIPVNVTNSLFNKTKTENIEAPFTLRMPISLFLFSMVCAERLNNPNDEITIASIAESFIKLPERFSS